MIGLGSIMILQPAPRCQPTWLNGSLFPAFSFPARSTGSLLAVVLLMIGLIPSQAVAQLGPSNVLVLYNSQVADSLEVFNYYSGIRTGVLGVDLNDATLGAGNISYGDYETKIRDKVRTHLTNNSLQQQVAVLVLTKGLPHRIQDTDNATVGDFAGQASNEWNNGDATYASVDSELTLLWENLQTGETGGEFDSHADNFVINPYHGSSSSITSFNRSSITSPNNFQDFADLNRMWHLPSSDPGDIYLTARLDGNTVDQVKDSIDRAQNVRFNQFTDRIIIDENDGNLTSQGDEKDDTTFFLPKSTDPSYQGNDYDETNSDVLQGNYSNVTFDESSTLLIGATGSVPLSDTQSVSGPVAALVSFGHNHTAGGNEGAYVQTFDGQPVDGAIFNTLESFNGKEFGGLTSSQGQVSEWIAAGGTFGIGNVYEPFAATLADNELLLDEFLFGDLTWVEAAWASTPYLSWQQIMVGDPLATAQVVPEPGAAVAFLLGTVLLAVRRPRCVPHRRKL